ncbi:hypothetical protein [Adhaeribacter soli]|uniref:YfhO family protein n=1 Tax=Adhaeribacter soli TaxID=2607655 RepID=A0A5N1IJU8_9BACT|nr:hypothetical protein [Adhaeribacter soli]KAA9326023.1 hypothetical protein F0P94_16535 [Adhaeribacter soli]
MSKKITTLLVLFLFLDICYSFFQYYYTAHDGDMAAIIAPAEWYSDVLKDPFGFSLLSEQKSYGGSNRFFAHWSLGAYFKTVPLMLQAFVSPLDSTYLASALAKIGIHLLIIWLLGLFITNSGKWWKPEFILAGALVAPFFQTWGYFDRVSIIESSITYTFFYALSTAILILFFLPFYQAYFLGQDVKFTLPKKIILFALTIILPFMGPLNLGIIAIVCSFTLAYQWWLNFRNSGEIPFIKRIWNSVLKIPKPLLFYFPVILLFSFYSLYIGSFNAESDNSISIADRYSFLLTGLNRQLFFGQGWEFSPAYSILFLLLIINSLILWKKGPEGKKIVKWLLWVIVFSIIYILLLPLGGYRSYRPHIVSGSTFQPVTLTLVFFYGLTCWYILRQTTLKYRKLYIGTLILVAVIFSSTERPSDSTYQCERNAILAIAASPEKHVDLETWCGVMSWGKITHPYYSIPGGKLLHYWGITKEEKNYTTGK